VKTKDPEKSIGKIQPLQKAKKGGRNNAWVFNDFQESDGKANKCDFKVTIFRQDTLAVT